ncbi:SDR family oxidoreductase [Patescibacteria group bacterium]|nr:SDR family oxidoreductase [Patescibacteria group bacterium]
MSASERPLLVISGGSGYIGSAIVAAFCAHQWNVVILSRTKRDSSQGFVIECDISDVNAVKRAAQQISEKFGKIHACIHAAATPLERVSIVAASTPALMETMTTAYLGAVHLAQVLIPHMSTGGAFIGITSQVIESDSGMNPLMGGYLPAKYALRGFLRALSAAPEARSLRVYALAPGFLPGGLNGDLPPIIQRVIAHQVGAPSSTASLGELAYTMAANPDAFLPGTSVQYPSLIAQSL